MKVYLQTIEQIHYIKNPNTIENLLENHHYSLPFQIRNLVTSNMYKEESCNGTTNMSPSGSYHLDVISRSVLRLKLWRQTHSIDASLDWENSEHCTSQT